jgi:diguanylate cyclase (GGDEF)-like protein
LVEDSRRDFRFDPEKNRSFDPRPILSIASCPLLVGNNLLGLLRLDSDEANVFSQEDLRLLCAISDLGGAAIENARLFQNMRELAIHDPLTSLFTKRHFLECLRQEISRSSLNQNNFSLLMLDIDFFKKYNDEFGHTAGDIVLNKISRLMRQELEGKKPVISRFGGEEFCLLLPGQRRKEAIEVAESLRQRIGKEKMILRRRETQVTVSIGIAEYPRDSLVDTELIQKADKMMYLAKQKGRNRVCAA